jgi:hypothetical protein
LSSGKAQTPIIKSKFFKDFTKKTKKISLQNLQRLQKAKSQNTQKDLLPVIGTLTREPIKMDTILKELNQVLSKKLKKLILLMIRLLKKNLLISQMITFSVSIGVKSKFKLLENTFSALLQTMGQDSGSMKRKL